jgi:hypothetical protein
MSLSKNDRDLCPFFSTVVFITGLVLGFTQCVHAADVATYEADGLACVDKGATRAEADTCRCGVEKRYDRPLRHCAPPPASDAGKDGAP